MAALHVSHNVGLPDSHRNSPLAPSQELAYRQKCVDLKKRLAEIEATNDSIRQRLARERHFQNKMRLNRAILLNHMKELVENPSRRYSARKLDQIRLNSGRRMSGMSDTRGNGYRLEESSDMNSSDEVQEQEIRPRRVKRARDGTPRGPGALNASSTTNTPAATHSAALPTYHSSGLPHIAPAHSYPSGVSTQAVESSPIQPHPASHLVVASTLASSTSVENALAPPPPPPPPPPPVRPIPPFEQFTSHLVPQLQADNIRQAEIGPKIRETWNEIGEAGQEPWQKKYRDEMVAYTRSMDDRKRMQREGSRGNKFVNGAGGGGGGGGGFSAVNR